MYVIGIGGFKRSGKDTFGRLLHEAAAQRGLTTVVTAFAEPVRKAAAAAYGYGTNTFRFVSSKTKDVVDPQWGITPRQMMINVGEAMRSIDPEHWVKLWRNSVAVMKDALVIVTDVRRLNEAVEVSGLHGTLVLLQRPAIEWDGTAVEWIAHHFAAPPHGPFSAVVKNDGDVASLRRHADRIVRRVLDKATKKS